MQRLNLSKIESSDYFKDPKREHLELSAVGLNLFAEFQAIIFRRMLLQGIKSTGLATIALLVTGLEEAVIRMTILPRDRLVRKLFGMPKPTPEQADGHNRIVSIMLTASMCMELSSIILCRMSFLVLYVGYSAPLPISYSYLTSLANC